MNRYPLWKYLIMIVAVAIGLFYTLPNVFPQVPAVQVSTNKSAVRLDAPLLDRVEKTLKAGNIAFTSSELDPANGVHIRFAKGDTAAQAKAKEVLIKDLNGGATEGSYIIALTAESTTPHWMQNLNAKPMALGLDLRGGVHFLMQVDMKGALDRAADRNAADIRSLLREKKIQYGGVDKSGETIAVKFSDPAEREKRHQTVGVDHVGEQESGERFLLRQFAQRLRQAAQAFIHGIARPELRRIVRREQEHRRHEDDEPEAGQRPGDAVALMRHRIEAEQRLQSEQRASAVGAGGEEAKV